MIDHNSKIILYEEKDNGYIGISYEPYLKKYIIHTECKKWTVSNYKRYLTVWNIIKKTLKKRGITEIYGLADNPKSVKFNTLFDAYPTGELAQTEDGEYNYLIRGEL